MYCSEHSLFIMSPLSDVLKAGISACKGVGVGIETYPLGEYIMQSLFLKLTGAQEQKMKCICWDMATLDFEYRYVYLNQKNYGECSDWRSKNGVYNDIIVEIQKKDSSFEPSTLIDGNFLTNILADVMDTFENSVLCVWQKREFDIYKKNYSKGLSSTQIGKSKNGNNYQIMESVLKGWFEEIVYKHRNRCAHNTLSYQINKPDLNILADNTYEYHNYFFRYAIIIVIDSIYMALFNKYLSLQAERV